jgi:hypothetical protein
MEKDEQPKRPNQPNNPQPNAPGGGGLLKLLPFLLLFLFKKPQLIIPVVIVGAIWYFFLGGSNMLNPSVLPAENTGDPTEFSLGFTPNEPEYDKRLVYAALADGKNTMPSKVSLLQYAPERLNQGRQGSCVGWASAYAARTILYARQTGQDPNRTAFSPSYVYNQIAFEGCQGTYLHYAMETMLDEGALPLSEFEYNEGSCRLKPSSSEVQQAQQFRIKGYERLSVGANNYKVDVNGIRQNLAAGAPVVIGMMVGESFTHGMRNREVWQPSRSDLMGSGQLGGHAMCVIGYDDTALSGKGAFQIMNSWGSDWGNNGIGWVDYENFEYFVKEAYGLYPMGQTTTNTNATKLAVEFGLLDNATQNNIPLVKFSDNIFRTKSPIKKGDKFKVEVTNSIECYTYVFAMETDGSSNVLFPYTEKHSAYCGVTGTRVFPNDYSMVADDLGSTDWIAVVVTKKPLDFKALNTAISQSGKDTYPGKVAAALSSELASKVVFSEGGNTIKFETDVKDKNAVAMLISIDKR